jgi:hypothetical protein
MSTTISPSGKDATDKQQFQTPHSKNAHAATTRQKTNNISYPAPTTQNPKNKL